MRRGFRCLPLLGSYFASGGRSSSPQGENPGRACEEPNSGSPHQPSPVPEKLEHLQESLAEGHALQPPLLPIPGPVFSPVRSLDGQDLLWVSRCASNPWCSHAGHPDLMQRAGMPQEEAALFPEEPAETFALRVGPEHEQASRDGERDGIALDDVAPEMASAELGKCESQEPTLQLRDGDSAEDSEKCDGGDAGTSSDANPLSSSQKWSTNTGQRGDGGEM